MVSAHRGSTRLGCLVQLLIVAALGYFGTRVGEVYMRAWRFEDAMRQELRFAGQRDDATIRRNLQSVVDSLGLPDEASRIDIERTAGRILITTDYVELVELPGHVREIVFTPTVTRRL